MSDTETEQVEKALSEMQTLQSVIDIFENKLRGLRTQCALDDDITQKTKKDTEGKLVLYFSRQIVIKSKLRTDDSQDKLADYPKTDQWLSVVGLRPDTITNLMAKEAGMNLYTLLELSEVDVKILLLKYNADAEDARRLNLALRNLKISVERELTGGMDRDIELHWTDLSSSVSRPSPRPSTSSLSSSDTSTTASSGPDRPSHSTPPSPVSHSHNERLRSVGYTPPPTPPTVRTPKTKYPITPPPKKKNLLFPEYPTISRSKSQESQLAHKVQDIDPVKSGKKNKSKGANIDLTLTTPQDYKVQSRSGKKKSKDGNIGGSFGSLGGSYDILAFRRLSSEHDGGGSRGPSGPASPIITSPIHSPPFVQGPGDASSLVVPGMKGPHMIMKHQIYHKYANKIMIGSTCDICGKNMFRAKYCKYCRFKCHRDCVSKAPASCGLPEEIVDVLMKTVFEGPSNPPRRTTTPNLLSHRSPDLRTTRSYPVFHVSDSSSASSTNSSTHSSPVPAGMSSSGAITSPSPYASPRVPTHSFQFPDISESSTDVTDVTQTEPILSNWDRDVDVVSTNTSNDSDKTIVDSNTSEVTLLDRVDSVDSQDDPLGHSWNRVYSLSVALKEWDIPYEELVQEEPIGTGRFGTVYKGSWHGDIAIKMLNVDPDTDYAAQLSAFKLEVAMLRKTRHENLVLFMGACMKAPHLAIVMSLCRGHSLFTLIHVRKEKLLLNKTILIAQQVAQGMGYLHAKNILHKDLKSKNVFLDKEKVVITDFGLFNVTKLCQANRHVDRLQIPPGWLCYLSPEIIRALQAGAAYATTDLPFTEMSDVYAFGTVWYELLNGSWPFGAQPAQSIIWQVGHGIKQSLGSIKGSKEVKDLLIVCWAFNPDDRPCFTHLLKIMERLPKKPFTRSPSHPIHLLSRSADSLHMS